jgi:branched-chain amino acid transport system substrate-binding protein
VFFDELTPLQNPSAIRAANRGPPFKLCAFIVALAMGIFVSGCVSAPPPPPPPPPPVVVAAPPPAVFRPPPRSDPSNYFRLRNTPIDDTPIRVALLLPFTNPSPETRAIAEAMQHSAELALFDSGNGNIILMPRDDGGSPELAVQAARQAINDGAEIILGPLFAQLAIAVGPVARNKRVATSFPDAILIADGGIMLQSLAPALALRSAGEDPNKIAPFESLNADEALNIGLALNIDEALNIPLPTSRDEVLNACKMEEGPDLAEEECEEVVTIPIPFRFLGTGLWDNPTVAREPILQNGWFAAPSPNAWEAFSARYLSAYGNEPPRISTLSYDAVSLVSLLSNGIPYHRFTDAALTDPNGFVGVDGIFRFNLDGVAERGLAVLEVGNGRFNVVDPAPTSFIAPGF